MESEKFVSFWKTKGFWDALGCSSLVVPLVRQSHVLSLSSSILSEMEMEARFSRPRRTPTQVAVRWPGNLHPIKMLDPLLPLVIPIRRIVEKPDFEFTKAMSFKVSQVRVKMSRWNNLAGISAHLSLASRPVRLNPIKTCGNAQHNNNNFIAKNNFSLWAGNFGKRLGGSMWKLLWVCVPRLAYEKYSTDVLLKVERFQPNGENDKRHCDR